MVAKATEVRSKAPGDLVSYLVMMHQVTRCFRVRIGHQVLYGLYWSFYGSVQPMLMKVWTFLASRVPQPLDSGYFTACLHWSLPLMHRPSSSLECTDEDVTKNDERNRLVACEQSKQSKTIPLTSGRPLHFHHVPTVGLGPRTSHLDAKIIGTRKTGAE